MKINKIITTVLFMFTVTLLILTFTPYWESLLANQAIPKTIDYLIHVGFISATILWVWMLSSFFKSGPTRYRVLIGFAMLIFNVLAAPIYWALFYVRQ